MAFISRDFAYMKPGSFAIMPGGKVVYLEDVPQELKERFETDVKQKYAETAERHRNGVFSSKDYY